MKTWTISGDYYVEIWFRIKKDKDGYPKHKEWEQLLARPLLEREDCFQIESIPFFLKNVSRGDIVKAKVVLNTEVQESEIFEFDEVLDRGGHNTYRLLIRNKRPGDPDFTETELNQKGLNVEQQGEDFFAIDVPPTTNQKAIDDYLVAEVESGRWELQDGYLSTIKIRN